MRVREQIVKELQSRWPSVAFSFGMRGRHAAVYLEHGGLSRFCVFSSTRTDDRAIKNKIAELRRLLKTMGVTPNDERRFHEDAARAETSRSSV